MGFVGERRGRDEVLAAHLGGVEAGAPSHEVDDPFDRVRRLGTAGASVRSDRCGVGGHRAIRGLDVGDAVRAGRHPGGEYRQTEAGGIGIRAEVLTDDHPQRPDAPVAIEPHVDVVLLVASSGHLHHRFGSRLRELDGTAQPLRQQRRHEQFGIPDDLGAETAADVGSDHATTRLRDVEERGQVVAQVVRRLERRPEREPRWRPVGQTRDRLDGDRCAPLVDDVQARTLVAPVEFAFEVVEHRHDGGHIGAMGGVQGHGIGRRRRRDRGHHGQRLVVDEHRLHAVGSAVAILRDHDGHRFTDEAHRVAREHRAFEVG